MKGASSSSLPQAGGGHADRRGASGTRGEEGNAAEASRPPSGA